MKALWCCDYGNFASGLGPPTTHSRALRVGKGVVTFWKNLSQHKVENKNVGLCCSKACVLFKISYNHNLDFVTPNFL